MIIKTTFALVLALASIFGHGFVGEESPNTRSDFSRNSCVSAMNQFSSSFDFGSSATSSSNSFSCKLFTENSTSFSYKGNIRVFKESPFKNGVDLSFGLPKGDGELTISTIANGEKRNVYLYSSLSSAGVYFLSSLSKRDAQYAAGNVPGQALFDHDEPTENTNSSELAQTGSTGTSGPQKVIASGRVKGYLKWTDVQGNIRPLIGAKVRITFTGSWGTAEGLSNSSGYYDISFNGIWTAWAFEADIHVYAENAMVRVANNNNVVYEKAERLSSWQNNSCDYSYTFNATDTTTNEAMEIFTGLKAFADYAQSLNGGSQIEQCTVKYPANEGTAYSNGENLINLKREEPGNSNVPATCESWDTIGHEYGHHLQKHYFDQAYNGNHVEKTTDFETYVKTKGNNNTSYVLPVTQYETAKKQSMGLAWKESWPTFFSISAQQSFSDDLKTIPTVGNSVYEGSNGVIQRLDSLYQNGGETSEEAIMCFLYQLWDNSNSAQDRLTISDHDLWTVMVSTNPEFFYSFVSAIYSSGLSFERSDLGALLEACHFSAANLSLTANITNYANIPTFRWDPNGSNVSYGSTTYSLSNDKFDLVFYDSSKMNIFERNGISGSSYTLSQLEWNRILAGSGTKYYAMIRSFDTFGSQSGPYYSQMYEFAKPVGAESTPNLSSFSSERYYEQTITIAPDTKWVMNLNFPTAGKKAIQTFGPRDSRIWLYQSDGTTLIASNDDSGYGMNPFLCLDAAANTSYILKIGFFSSALGGETKLSIAPFTGYLANGLTACSAYDDFLDINTYPNFTWTSYMSFRSSNIITWTPPESGNYTISLESSYDNYLYLFDPRSNDPMVRNVDFNDDSSGTNASLTKSVTAGIKYFLVYSQYNPDRAFVNGDTLIRVKFQKN
jgi:hypothetical protein